MLSRYWGLPAHLARTVRYCEIALISALVGRVLTLIHLIVTTPLESVGKEVEVASGGAVLVPGCSLADFDRREEMAGRTFGHGWSNDTANCAGVSLQVSSRRSSGRSSRARLGGR